MPLDLRLDIPTFDAAALPAAAAVLDLSLPGRLSVDGPLAIRARTQGTVDQLSVEGSVDATRAAVRWGTDFAKLGDLALEAGVSGARDAGAPRSVTRACGSALSRSTRRAPSVPARRSTCGSTPTAPGSPRWPRCFPLPPGWTSVATSRRI